MSIHYYFDYAFNEWTIYYLDKNGNIVFSNYEKIGDNIEQNISGIYKRLENKKHDTN